MNFGAEPALTASSHSASTGTGWALKAACPPKPATRMWHGDGTRIARFLAFAAVFILYEVPQKENAWVVGNNDEEFRALQGLQQSALKGV